MWGPIYNIAYSFYELTPKSSLNVVSSVVKRQGALLKVTDLNGKVGYADCCSWPELGDFPLKAQLDKLTKGELTPLTHCALEWAELDAQARHQKKSILKDLKLPRSHFLINHCSEFTSKDLKTLILQGYTHVKLKMGRDVQKEINFLHSVFKDGSIKLRLDFNESLNYFNFCDFLLSIEKLQSHIDFIEDPFPFDLDQWSEVQKSGWTLACDRKAHFALGQPDAARVIIIKPALIGSNVWKERNTSQIFIVTSYLGHPLGQMAAAYVAFHLDPTCRFVHGLLSHHAYQSNDFSQFLNWESPEFTLPPGTGFGFDFELQNVYWKLIEEI